MENNWLPTHTCKIFHTTQGILLQKIKYFIDFITQQETEKSYKYQILSSHTFNYIVLRVNHGLSSCKDLAMVFCRAGKLLACSNGPYSLHVCASYFISCSVHAQFASVPSVDYKWCWGCRHF